MNDAGKGMPKEQEASAGSTRVHAHGESFLCSSQGATESHWRVVMGKMSQSSLHGCLENTFCVRR